MDRVVEAQAGRLTLITAGAGFGKTTLAAEAASAIDRPVAWLSCDPRTSTSAAFGRQLIAAIGLIVPGFGAAVVMPDAPEDVAAALVNEIVAVGPDRMTIVVDDAHVLGVDASRVTAALAGHLPQGIHLVLASREKPPFSVARLRLAGVCEIGERDLALTEDEIAGLLRLQGRDPSRASDAHRRTDGWPAAVILIGTVGDDSGADVVAPGSLFEYLSEEALDLVGPDGQRLLDATALCGRLTPRMAVSALGDDAAGAVLRRLAGDSFLVVPLEGPGEWFRYHALLREFLASRADALDPAARRALHARTADAWLVEGEVAQAVPHLIDAGEHRRAAGLIAGVADVMSGSDQAPVLAGWLERLPAEVLNADPALIAASGYLLFGMHRYDAAFDRLFLAVGRMAEAGSAETAAVTLFRLLEVLETCGEFTRAVGVCQAVLPTLPADDGLLTPALRLRLAGFLGNLGRFSEADDILREIEASPAAAASPVLSAYAEFVRAWAVDHAQGRSRAALASMTRVAERLESDPQADLLRLLPWVYALRGVVHHALVEDAGVAVDIARFAEIALRYGVNVALEPIVARARMGQMLREERLDELDIEIARWDEHFTAWKDVNWNYHYFRIAAAVHVQRERLPQALAALAHFRQTLIDRAPLIEQARLLPDGALLAMAAGDPGLAADLASLGIAAADATGAPWALVHANAVGAAIQAGTPAGSRMLETALEASRGGGAVDAWTRMDRVIAPALLATAMREGVGSEEVVLQVVAACDGELVGEMARLLADAPGGARVMLARAAGSSAANAAVIEDLLRDRDVRVREAARAGWNRRRQGARARVEIVSFGDLVVMREGRRVDPAVFGRQKSRALLAMLLAAGGSAHRDRLCDALWPDLAPERAAAALRSTLHDLRRGLEPEAEVGSPSALVRNDGEFVRLEPAEGDAWDLLTFRAHLVRARSAVDPAVEIAEYLAAERLAGRPFLTEWEFEDWSREARAEVAREVLGLRADLARAFSASGRPEEAIPRLRALCDAEPEREEWHRRLMRAYAAAGERALALRQFHVLRGRLRRDQGIEPVDETRSLYRDLLRA